MNLNAIVKPIKKQEYGKKIITIEEQVQLSILAGICFADNPFYRTLDEDKQKCLFKIQRIFSESVGICSRYGYVNMVQEKGEIIGFCLSVDYNRLLSDRENFEKLFSNEINPEYVKEDELPIVELMNKHMHHTEKVAYVLAIGVHSDHRRKGHCRNLLLNTLLSYPGYCFYTDITNNFLMNSNSFTGFQVLHSYKDFSFVRYCPGYY